MKPYQIKIMNDFDVCWYGNTARSVPACAVVSGGHWRGGWPQGRCRQEGGRFLCVWISIVQPEGSKGNRWWPESDRSEEILQAQAEVLLSPYDHLLYTGLGMRGGRGNVKNFESLELWRNCRFGKYVCTVKIIKKAYRIKLSLSWRAVWLRIR